MSYSNRSSVSGSTPRQGARRGIAAVVCLAVATVAFAEDFQWKFSDKPTAFQWKFSDATTHRDKVAVDPSECVFDIEVGPDWSRRHGGACVHIGNGFFLTAGHVLRHVQKGWYFWIDRKQVAVQEWRVSAQGDFGFVHASELRDRPAVEYQVKPLGRDLHLEIRSRYTQTSITTNGVVFTSGEMQADVDKGKPATVNGDSGGGIFNQEGVLVGILRATDNQRVTTFTPLSLVADVIQQGTRKSSPVVRASEGDEVLEFGATWCGPCGEARATIKPKIEAAGWPVREIDVDSHRALVNQYRITQIPCFVVLQGGVEVARSVGVSMPNLPGRRTAGTGDAPTPYSQIAAIFESELLPGKTVVDPGCGDARALIIAVEQFHAQKGIGVEINPDKAAEARARVKEAGLSDKIEIVIGDSTTMDLKGDVVFLYLYPQTIAALNLKNFEKVISFRHPVPGLSGVKKGDFYVYQGQKKAAQATQGQYAWKQVWVSPWQTPGYECGDRSCIMCYGGYEWRWSPVE